MDDNKTLKEIALERLAKREALQDVELIDLSDEGRSAANSAAADIPSVQIEKIIEPDSAPMARDVKPVEIPITKPDADKGKEGGNTGIGRFVLAAILMGGTFLVVLGVLVYVLFRDYTITMNMGDGTTPAVIHYNANSHGIALGIPEREGYRFIGWTGSNGDEPQRDIIISAGTIGNRYYMANWTDDVVVYCEDWLIDTDGNRIKDISKLVDDYLGNDEIEKTHQPIERELYCKIGESISPSRWGDDISYKAYSDQFMYVDSSEDTTVMKDGQVVYRYFYVVLDVNISVDDEPVASDPEIGTFTLKVNGDTVASDTDDFCKGIPYAAEYEICDITPGENYVYTGPESITGTMTDIRENLVLEFASK